MRINTFSDVLAKADNISDFIPVLSTVSNLVDLFNKYVVFYIMKAAGADAGKIRYFSHLNKKSFARCILLLFPILGNIVIGIYEHLRRDKKYMLNAVKEEGILFDLSHACKKLRGDKDVVLAAVNKLGSALYDASKELQDDKEVVLAAINCYLPTKNSTSDERFGWVVQFASKRLRGDKEVMFNAVQTDEFDNTLTHATEELQNDKDFVIKAVQHNYRLLSHVVEKFKGDRDVILAGVKRNYRALEYATPELRTDREIVLTAFRHLDQFNDWDQGITKYLTDTFRSDKEFMLEAVRYHEPALKCVSDDLKQHKEFMAAATEAAKAGKTHRENLQMEAYNKLYPRKKPFIIYSE